MIKFTATQNSKFAFIEFELTVSAIAPDLLQRLHPPDMVKHKFAHKGVILSGRGPVWLYGFLIHFYHPTRMIAVYDPRLQGAVVVSSHHKDYRVGALIPEKAWVVKK